MTLVWRMRVMAAMVVLPPFLRVVPLDNLVTHLGRRATVKRPSAEQQAEIVAMVERWLGRLPPPWRLSCLTRSVVLYHLFRRAGIPVDLVVGVRRSGDEMQAHAWLAANGAPYLEREPVDSYQTIGSFARR